MDLARTQRLGSLRGLRALKFLVGQDLVAILFLRFSNVKMRLMKDSNPKIKLILLTTGGTIEKTYDEIAGSLENRDSIIQKRITNKLRLPYTDIEAHSIMNKDSLQMDDTDRQEICEQIAFFQERKHPIIVLHGTDSMALSMRYCAERLVDISVPVIFTGAMRPQEFEDSDALQNVTEAFLAAKILAPGFYIVFHNRVFSSSMDVYKNVPKATFELA